MRKVYQSLASAIVARANCIQVNNVEWRDRHEETIDTIVDNLPSGGGIDNGTKIDLDASGANRIVLSVAYHHMNENGYYDGWTDHKITIVPSFDGIDLRISGRNRNDIKDYLAETYHYALTQECREV